MPSAMSTVKANRAASGLPSITMLIEHRMGALVPWKVSPVNRRAVSAPGAVLAFWGGVMVVGVHGYLPETLSGTYDPPQCGVRQ